MRLNGSLFGGGKCRQIGNDGDGKRLQLLGKWQKDEGR